jgi:hypothetical protein
MHKTQIWNVQQLKNIALSNRLWTFSASWAAGRLTFPSIKGVDTDNLQLVQVKSCGGTGACPRKGWWSWQHACSKQGFIDPVVLHQNRVHPAPCMAMSLHILMNFTGQAGHAAYVHHGPGVVHDECTAFSWLSLLDILRRW